MKKIISLLTLAFIALWGSVSFAQSYDYSQCIFAVTDTDLYGSDWIQGNWLLEISIRTEFWMESETIRFEIMGNEPDSELKMYDETGYYDSATLGEFVDSVIGVLEEYSEATGKVNTMKVDSEHTMLYLKLEEGVEMVSIKAHKLVTYKF